MDPSDFDQRLAGMHDHERQMAASWRKDQAALNQAKAALNQANAHIRVLDKRALDLEGVADLIRRASVQVTSSPRTYSADSPHSWFVDLYRAQFGNNPAARKRLEAHAREAAADEPRRAEMRARAAQRAYEAAFGGTIAEQQALAAFTGAGGVLFERRAATRVDGDGGYFIPPAWLVDATVPAPRASAALAAAVRLMPLPDRCDSVNIPRIETGTATGMQPGDATPLEPSSLADSFASHGIRSVVGVQDVSQMWLDQGIGGAGAAIDQLLWDDLHADMMLQIDGNLILGSGSDGQMTGLLPSGTTIGTALAVYAPNSDTGSGQALYYNGGSGTALATTIGQCISGVRRARGANPTHLLTNPWVWDMITTQADQQSRPYVEPHGPMVSPGGATEPGPGSDCILGHSHGLPILGDLNIPTTLGGTEAPYLGLTSGSQVAAQPGSGSYTPIIPIRASDIHVFMGQPHMRLLREVLSGTLAYRFQLYCYVTVVADRYVAQAAGTLANSGGWAAGACSSYGIVTQQGSNSLLSLSSFGG